MKMIITPSPSPPRPGDIPRHRCTQRDPGGWVKMIIEVRINIVTHLEVSPREVNLAIVRIRKLRTLLLWPEMCRRFDYDLL